MPAPEWDSVLSHLGVFAGGGLVGRFFMFLNDRLKLTGDQQGQLLVRCLERIEHLENEQKQYREREVECETRAARQDEQIKNLTVEVHEVRAQLDAALRKLDSET